MATLDWYGTSVLKIRFEDRKWVNRVYFELTNQPLTWQIMYYDYNRDAMVELIDAGGNPIAGSLGSDPDANKYIPHKFTFPLTHTNLIELHVERGRTATTSASEWSSIAIRNVDFAHEIWHRDQVPPTFDSDITIRSPLGHVERLLLDDWDASRAIDGFEDTYWQCEPQPAGDAIVPFYLDVRGPDGAAQLVDRLEMDPIYPGPSMNVYYSNDDNPATSFQLSNTRLLLDVNGTLAVSRAGAKFSSTLSSLRLANNDKMRLDLNRPWSLMSSYTPGYPATTITTELRTIWTIETDSDDISLIFDPAGDQFRVVRGATVLVSSAPMTFTTDSNEYGIIVGWRVNQDGDEEWILNVHGDTTIGTSARTPSIVQSFVLGNSVDDSTHAHGSLRDVIIRQEAYDANIAEGYIGRTDAMIAMLGPMDRSRGDWDAVFFAHLSRDVDARVGPGNDFYAFKTWVPIVRDYTLNKGVFSLPPTKCKYIKLEFSDLIAKPYPVYREGLKRTVKTYPQWVHQWYATIEQHTRQASREAERTATRKVTRYQTHYSTSYSNQVSYDYAFSKTMTHPVMSGDPVTPKRGETSVRDYNVLHWKPEVGAVRRVGKVIDSTKSSYTVAMDFYRKKETTVAHTSSYTTSYQVDEQYQQAFNEAFTEEYEVRQTERKRFFRTVRHEYDEREVEFIAQQAYFVGINDVRVLRVDASVGEDTPEYIETFEDDSLLELNEWDLDTITDKAKATAENQRIITKTLPSFSQFKTVQIACQGSGWESQLSDAQMSFVISSHITADNATTEDVAGQITGEGAGRVLRVAPVTSGSAYGIYTEAGIYSTPEATQTYDNATGTYDSSNSYDGSNNIISEGVRTSAVMRIYLPETARGTYELRLMANGAVRAKTTRKFVPRKWIEVDIPFLATEVDFDFQVAVYQTDTAVSEPFDVDFLGIFQNPIKWEISNDGGTTYKTILVSINNPNAYVTLPTAGNQLKLRITAQRAGVVLQSFVVVPWYIESMLVQKIPIDYMTPWGGNELTELRAPENKPEFKLWNRFFPQRYSLQQVGSVPTTGQGIRL